MKNFILRSVLLAALLPVFFILPNESRAWDTLHECVPDTPMVWGAGGVAIPFNPDQGNLGPLTNAQASAAVAAAFGHWTGVGTSTISFVDGGPLPVDVDITNFNPWLNPGAPTGFNAIVFDDTGEIFDSLFGAASGVLGFASPTWGNFVTCEIVEGHAWLNGPAFGDLAAAMDVMVHEFGHFSNLGHTVVNGEVYFFVDETGPTPENPFVPPNPLVEDVIETMYPFYGGPGLGTFTPAADDIAGISTLYPEPAFGALASITGTVYHADGSTPVVGANVIARNVANPFYDAVSAISGHLGVPGEYNIHGLTPGADYVVYIDQILAGGFSTPPIPFPGPEEYFNGASESNNSPGSPDDPADVSLVNPDASGVDIIFNLPSPGDPLPVGDDGSFELPIGFDFEICGQMFNTVHVNANGNLTFGQPDGDFSESTTEFLRGVPRIAGLWDDLNPNGGGIVTFDFGRRSFTAIWEDVPEFPAAGSNSFSITLLNRSNGIDVEYGDMTALDGIAGLSCGSKVTSGFETGTDLSAEQATVWPDRIDLHKQPAVFEDLAPNDLANSVLMYTGSTDYHDKWAGKNDSMKFARNLELPFDSTDVDRFTEIDPAGDDVDYFRFIGYAGDLFLAEVIAGDLDTLMALYDSDGNLIALDDDGGSGLLSRIFLGLPEDGEYFLAVSTFADFDFSGDGFSGGRYVLTIESSEEIFVPLALGDDDSAMIQLPFAFPFQGNVYGSVYVNSNGSLTFGEGDTDFSESVSDFLNGPPRIAPLWDDLNPTQGGSVFAVLTSGQVSVIWEDVPEWFSTGENTFGAFLLNDGVYAIAYGDLSATDGLAGTTEGGGVADPGESDLSSALSWPVLGTTYEHFTAGDNDLDGDLSIFHIP